MRRLGIPSIVLLVLLLSSPVLQAETAPKHDISVDDYFTLGNLFDIALSPQGNAIAYTEGRWQLSTDDRKADLWVVSTRNGPARRLTFDRASDRSPAWDAASRHVYFLGNRKREGEKQHL